MTANDPTGALTGEFHPGRTPKDLLPQRTPGSTLGIDAVAEAEVQRAARRIESEGTR